MSSPIMVGHMEKRAINQLREYPQNARTHSEAQIEQIVASIREFGFVNPILIGSQKLRRLCFECSPSRGGWGRRGPGLFDR